MRTTIILCALATCSLFANKLQAQDPCFDPPVEEQDHYDTFSAIFDEVGFKADVYRGHGPSTTANHTRMHIIETWTATEAWEALTDKEQASYLRTLDAPDRFVLVNGVKIIKMGDNEEDQLVDVDYFTIWSVPDEERGNGLEQLVVNAGWYTYFRQTNVSNKDSLREEVIGYLFRH